MPFTIAIVGRPNVGKSSIFNRLVGRKLALVDKTPGLTRDRREGFAEIGGQKFRFIDTAGLEDGEPGSITASMRQQSEVAIREADLVMFVVDGRSGLLAGDHDFARLVRHASHPVLLVVNKCEGRRGMDGAYESFDLGLGDPIIVAAEHGLGFGELARAMVEPAEQREADALAELERQRRAREAAGDQDGDGVDMLDDGQRHALKLAVIGRPNAGKSTLVNALLGEERMITGPEAGITRDSISVDIRLEGRDIKLFDTAGMRKKARINDPLEILSVGDALRAIRFAEVVVLLIDAQIPFEKQDLQLANLIANEGRGLVIAVNKWDTVRNKQERLTELLEMTENLLPQVRGVSLITVSALNGKGLDRLIRAVLRSEVIWNTRISTGALNRFLADAVERHTPPAVSGRRIRLRYMTQPNARPPNFVVFCSRPKELPEAYRRYLVNGLREQFGLSGTPMRLQFRGGKNPYVDRDKD